MRSSAQFSHAVPAADPPAQPSGELLEHRWWNWRTSRVEGVETREMCRCGCRRIHQCDIRRDSPDDERGAALEQRIERYPRIEAIGEHHGPARAEGDTHLKSETGHMK